VSAAAVIAPDAGFALGIASTAMPFARSREDEVEHWLRILRLSGDAGAALQALGVGENRIDSCDPPSSGSDRAKDRDVVTAVATRALQIAEERLSAILTTTDLLLATIAVYGPTFERVLAAHGVELREVVERLGAEPPVALSDFR